MAALGAIGFGVVLAIVFAVCVAVEGAISDIKDDKKEGR